MKKIILLIAALFVYSFLFSAVEFIDFDADVQDMNVVLSWSTATETENLGFIIERKTDPLAVWDPLVSYLQDDALLGQGTVTYQSDYLFRDSTVTNDTYYYRISGVDEASVIGLLDSLSITVAETAVQMEIPYEFKLNCYPNPFNPSVAISYQLSANSRVKASIYDINGRLIEELVNSDRTAGLHKLNWNARTMPGGIYIIKMIAGNVTISNKIILLK